MISINVSLWKVAKKVPNIGTAVVWEACSTRKSRFALVTDQTWFPDI